MVNPGQVDINILFITCVMLQVIRQIKFYTNVFHGEPPAGFQVGLGSFHRARREGHISPDHGLLHGSLANVGRGNWRSSFLHLNSRMHIGGFAGRRSAFHGSGHGCWARHLRNVVLGSRVGGGQGSGHGWSRACGDKRRLSLVGMARPLSLVVHALI